MLRGYHQQGAVPAEPDVGRAPAPNTPRLRAAGDEHSSHSDEELITALPNTYFKPVKCPEEEDANTTQLKYANPERPVRQRPDPTDVPPTRRATVRRSGLSTWKYQFSYDH